VLATPPEAAPRRPRRLATVRRERGCRRGKGPKLERGMGGAKQHNHLHAQKMTCAA